MPILGCIWTILISHKSHITSTSESSRNLARLDTIEHLDLSKWSPPSVKSSKELSSLYTLSFLFSDTINYAVGKVYLFISFLKM